MGSALVVSLFYYDCNMKKDLEDTEIVRRWFSIHNSLHYKGKILNPQSQHVSASKREVSLWVYWNSSGLDFNMPQLIWEGLSFCYRTTLCFPHASRRNLITFITSPIWNIAPWHLTHGVRNFLKVDMAQAHNILVY